MPYREDLDAAVQRIEVLQSENTQLKEKLENKPKKIPKMNPDRNNNIVKNLVRPGAFILLIVSIVGFNVLVISGASVRRERNNEILHERCNEHAARHNCATEAVVNEFNGPILRCACGEENGNIIEYNLYRYNQ